MGTKLIAYKVYRYTLKYINATGFVECTDEFVFKNKHSYRGRAAEIIMAKDIDDLKRIALEFMLVPSESRDWILTIKTSIGQIMVVKETHALKLELKEVKQVQEFNQWKHAGNKAS